MSKTNLNYLAKLKWNKKRSTRAKSISFIGYEASPKHTGMNNQVFKGNNENQYFTGYIGKSFIDIRKILKQL